MEALARLHHRHLALAANEPNGLPALERVQHYHHSLPPVPTRNLALPLIFLAGITTAGISKLVEPPLATFLQTSWFYLFTLDFGELSAAALELDGKPTGTFEDLLLLYVALFFMSLSLYIPLSVLVGSFRLKRAILCGFNEARESGDLTRRGFGRAVYDQEDAIFKQLGAISPKEFPVDVARGAILPGVLFLGSLSLFVSPIFWADYTVPLPTSIVAFPYMCALVLGIPFARLFWLYAAWRDRSPQSRSGPARSAVSLSPRARRRAKFAIAWATLGLCVGFGAVTSLPGFALAWAAGRELNTHTRQQDVLLVRLAWAFCFASAALGLGYSSCLP
jgi:hypothetical protein